MVRPARKNGAGCAKKRAREETPRRERAREETPRQERAKENNPRGQLPSIGALPPDILCAVESLGAHLLLSEMPEPTSQNPTAGEMNAASFLCPVASCAACGMITAEETCRMSRSTPNVSDLFPERRHQHSARENGLFKDLVSEDGSFDVCQRCANAIQSKKPKIIPAWRFDHGCAAGLPVLSVVEKASIAQVRVYGRVLKIIPTGKCGALSLSGHIINFQQDSKFSLERVTCLPHKDLVNLVSVIFLGASAVWTAMLPQLRGSGGLLQVRPAAVRMWLVHLKAVNPHYRDMAIDFADEAAEASVSEMIENACVGTSILATTVDRAQVSNIADGERDDENPIESCRDAATGEYVLSETPAVMSEVFLQRPELYKSTAKDDGAAVMEALKIRAADKPMNEFDQPEDIVCLAFPWAFPLGSLWGSNSKMTDDGRRQIVLFYDKRVSCEVNIIFMMFNQLCRHRVAANIAHANVEDMALIDEACRDPGYVEKVFAEDADAAGKEMRRKLISAVGVAQKNIPFSKTEMSKAFIGLVSTVRWRLAPIVFLTVSPSAVDNSLALRLTGCNPGEDYTVRSNAVYESPGASALFYKTFLDRLKTLVLKMKERKRTANVSELESGVFGKVTSMALTTEVQGRTLLHAHILIWNSVGPDVSQHAVFKKMSGWIERYVEFADSISKTNMPGNFWDMSNDLWEKRELPDPPGATPIPEDAALSQERLDTIIHKYNLHRQHKPTCFKNGSKCRLGMPANHFEGKTGFYGVTLVKGDPKSGTEDGIEYIESPETRCTHVLPNCGCKMEDLNRISNSPLCSLVQHRPKGQNQLVTPFTPPVAQFASSNTCTVMLSTMEQANACILYILKYNTKRKETAANCLSAAIAARNKMAAKAGGGDVLTDRSLYNAFANAYFAQTEIASTMAAYALIGGSGFFSTETFWHIFPWPVVEKPKKSAGKNKSGGKAAETNDNAPDVEILGGEGFEDCGNKSRIFMLEGERRFNATQDRIYSARPKRLDNLSFLLFSLMFEIEECDGDGPGGGRERNMRMDFPRSFDLFPKYRLVMRSFWPCPVFAGSPPPAHPARPMDRHVESALWARYWSAVAIPWRGKPKLFTYPAFSSWLEKALSGSCSQSRVLARVIVNVSFETRRNSLHARILNEARMLRADRQGAVSIELGESHARFSGEEAASIAEIAVEMQARARQTDDRSVAALGLMVGCLDGLGSKLPHSPWSTISARLGLDEEIASWEFAPEPPRPERQAHEVQNISATTETENPLLQDNPKLNKKQNEVRRRIIDSLANSRQGLVFVQGEAGTGKTHTVKAIYEELSPTRGGKFMKFMTPTGVAAENLMMGASTIHRSLGLKIVGDMKMTDSRLKIIAPTFDGVEVVVVDEISMVQPKMLNAINLALISVARSLGRINYSAPFGGFTMLLMGDFRQIPPVGSKSLITDALEHLGGACHWRGFQNIILDEQVRAEDPGQRAFVESLRGGLASFETIKSIKVLTQADLRGGFLDGSFFVTTLNSERHSINSTLAASFAKSRGYPVLKWRHKLQGSKGSTASCEIQDFLYDGCPDLWSRFVPGAPGMIMANINPSCGLSNGSNCTLVAISPPCKDDMDAIAAAGVGEEVVISMPEHVFVNVPSLDLGVPHQVINGIKCVPIKQTTGDVSIGKKNKTIPYKSHPVCLCFALTAHKCQGKTLKRVVLCLSRKSGSPKITFEQFLVASTRVRSFSDMRRLYVDDAGMKDMEGGLRASPDFDVYFDRRMFDKDTGIRRYDALVQRKTAVKRARETTGKEALGKTRGAKIGHVESRAQETPCLAIAESDPEVAGETIPYEAIAVALSKEEGLPMESIFYEHGLQLIVSNQTIVDRPFHAVLVVGGGHFVYAYYESGHIKVTESLVEHGSSIARLEALAPMLARAFQRDVGFSVCSGPLQPANECAVFSTNNLLAACGSSVVHDRKSIVGLYKRAIRDVAGLVNE